MSNSAHPTEDTVQPTRRGPGRPRHADTEARAYRAVLELFGQKGWSSLSLDAVAQRAGVGKSSIYLRWKDKGELLLDAMRDMESHHVYPDQEGLGVRDYLLAYAHGRADLYLGEYGAALVSLMSAAFSHPDEFHDLMAESINNGILQAVGRIDKAIGDGELREDTSATDLLSALEGGIFFRMFIYRQGMTAEDRAAALDDAVTDLVDMVLASVTT